MASLPQQNTASWTEPSPGHQGAWAGRATLRWHRGVGGQRLSCWCENQVTRARTLLLPPDEGRTRGRRGLVGGVQAQWGLRPLCSPTASAMALGPPPLRGTHVPGGRCGKSLNSVPVTDRLSKVLTGVQGPQEASRSPQRCGKAGQRGPACQEANPSVEAAWTETRGGC